MAFCREFGMSPTEYAEQPADVILGWYRMLEIEAEERERSRARLDRGRLS